MSLYILGQFWFCGREVIAEWVFRRGWLKPPSGLSFEMGAAGGSLTLFVFIKSIFVLTVLWWSGCNGRALLPSGALGVCSLPCISLRRTYNWNERKYEMTGFREREREIVDSPPVSLCKWAYSILSTRYSPNSQDALSILHKSWIALY